MRKPEDSLAIHPDTPTRQRLVLAARKLFYEQGYEGTSMQQILSEAAVNSGSLYYYFKSKEDLLLAVLDFYTDALHPILLDPIWASVVDPIERVFALMAGYREMLVGSGFTAGCPIGNLALEMSERSEHARCKIALNFEGWRAAVRQCFFDAEMQRCANVDCDKLATLVLSVMEGGVMLARTHRRIEPFDDSIAMLRDYVTRLRIESDSSPDINARQAQTKEPQP
jgi:TetR/AcrR family transcriptional repressor of nem operon